ncbi:tyrosine phosphatase family-domain-containing protein [Xylaria longipes]|nr:tyrosine phosphatase family-domain-containing protein [Xylaria longipes]RYC64967.1 hypothetical protein CHU98_g1279 [Xylaria longipes]
MSNINLDSDLPYMAGPKSVKSERDDQNTLQSLEVTSRRTSLPKIALRESQNCAKRLMLGRPVPTSLTPPVNFSMVSEGLYRSGYPQAQDFPFMQNLKLKTIVTLVKKELPGGYQEFIESNGITHKIFDMSGTKKEEIPIEMMRSIQAVVSRPENYPLLIHCNHGKHRTGCVVGVLRKANQWNVKRIIDEYTSFAEPKVRETDIKYLSEFKLASLLCQPRDASSSKSRVPSHLSPQGVSHFLTTDGRIYTLPFGEDEKAELVLALLFNKKDRMGHILDLEHGYTFGANLELAVPGNTIGRINGGDRQHLAHFLLFGTIWREGEVFDFAFGGVRLGYRDHQVLKSLLEFRNGLSWHKSAFALVATYPVVVEDGIHRAALIPLRRGRFL